MVWARGELHLSRKLVEAICFLNLYDEPEARDYLHGVTMANVLILGDTDSTCGLGFFFMALERMRRGEPGYPPPTSLKRDGVRAFLEAIQPWRHSGLYEEEIADLLKIL